MNEKEQLLDVYYYINMDDTNLIEECLRLQLKINQKLFHVNKFVNCKQMILGKGKAKNKDEDDIIKCGLLSFNDMFKNLKLKTKNETWFFYISNGDINDTYKNVFVTLLNKNPSEQQCYYVINKNSVTINKADSKYIKMANIKTINATISELFTCEKSITYTNLE